MKRRGVLSAVGVAIFLLLIMAFVLLPVVSATDENKFEIRCQVSPPVDSYYNENFTYSVTVTNNDFWRGDITSTLIHIYPSETATDYHLQDNSTTIQIPSGQSKTVSFKNVRLSDPNVYNDLRRDSEYQEWLRNDRLSEWTQLWYKFYVTLESSGETIPLECKGTGPTLKKCLRIIDYAVEPTEPEMNYYSSNFTYSVNIRNEGENELKDVEVTLRRGPNEDRIVDYEHPPKSVNIPGGGEITVSLEVPFHHPNFKKDQKYREWLRPNVTSKWGNAWYEFEVEWEGEVHTDGEDYAPVMGKPIFKCYNPKVVYNETKCDISKDGLMPFDFCCANMTIAKPDNNVTLLVKNYTSNEWEVKSFANYTSEHQENQTLVWHANLSKHNLNIDSSKVSSTINYKFYSPEIGKDCEYPEYPTLPSLYKRLGGTVKSSSVDPREGTYNNSYTYNLEVNWPICDIFELQVRNYTKSDYWDTMGKLSYRTPGADKTLSTPPINLTSNHFRIEKDGQYRFVSKVLNKNFTFGGPIWTINLTWEDITFNPKSGLYNYEFDFSMDVKAKKNLTVKLFTICPNGEKKESEDYYTKSPEWQTLNWSVRPCEDRAIGIVKYRFEFWYNSPQVGTMLVNKIDELEGPKVEIGYFANPKVDPMYGNWSDYFNYSLDVSAAERTEIELEIYHYAKHDWVSLGAQEYNASKDEWQTLWWKETPFGPGCKGETVYYRFWWDNTLLEIEGETTFEGPHLIEPIEKEFKNETVNLKTGYYNDSFTYSVYVKLNNEEEIILEVCNISTDKWEERGKNRSYTETDNWQLLIWKNITNIAGPGVEGYAKYRFFFIELGKKYESITFYGPLLKLYPTPTPTPTPAPHGGGGGGGGGGSSYKPYMLYENANVKPSDCTLKGAIESKTFNYTVEVDKDDKLILEIYNPSSEEWEGKGKGEKSKLTDKKSKWKHEWAVDLTLNKNWAGHGKYRFYPERKEKYRSQVYYGPEIKMPSLSEWKKEIGFSDKVLEEPTITPTVDPEEGKWFKKFTYTAEISHPDRANMTVVLFVYKPGSNEWEPVPWRGDRFNPIINPSDYNERNSATVSWTVEKEDIFAEKDAGESSKFSRFYIWYWDGWNEADCKKLESEDYEGPEVLEKPELHVNHEPVYTEFSEITPDPGSTHCVYEYKFGVNDPDNDTVHGWLTITGPPKVEAWQTMTDPPNETYIIGGDGSGGNISFRVGPDRGIFTDKKVKEYLKRTNKTFFTSSYRLEYWDEGMMVDGKTNQEPKDGWFTGPNVTEVHVTYTEPEVSPNRGTYADEFEIRIEEFCSDRDNTISLNLTIYDPTDRNKTWYPEIGRTIDLEVPAGGKKPASWKIKPEVFGPEDCGKTANYTIEWTDSFGNGDIINGTGPYIERAVPLLSLDPPLVPLVSMVIVPLGVIGISLLSVLSGVPVSSLFKNVSSKLRKGRAKGTEKKKEGEKEEKKEEAGES